MEQASTDTRSDPDPPANLAVQSPGAFTLADGYDRALHATVARLTAGLSPSSLLGAYLDWATHLGFSPGKQMRLEAKAARKAARFLAYALSARAGETAPPCIEPLPQDHRFVDPAWQTWPYNLIHQGFLLQQQWWHNATTGVPGVTRHHEDIVAFTARQILDVFSPSNFIFTNPEIIRRTMKCGGMNLLLGFSNWCEDIARLAGGKPPAGADSFEVGRDVAVTAGKVIYRNHLIELIQYLPTTPDVKPEPILIVPAWIMKYYILDLSPHNSLVKYLTDQGFTVFMISWRNPGAEDRDLTLDDYRELGVMAALDAIGQVVPGHLIHGVGYCLGGTLLTIAAAEMGARAQERLASMTLFAAQADFSDAGELSLFIDESQLAFVEDIMWEQGFLDSTQMAGAFQLLRSNDLIWSHLIKDYLMGERTAMTDLMAWNADATRMPYRMHAQYLRELFLNNDLAEGRFRAGGKPIALNDITVPIFAVGAEWDHVAPWRSAHKIHLLVDADITFLLTTGGHNAGIVSEPGHPGRHYRFMTKHRQDAYLDPDRWVQAATQRDGSWWPEWTQWLAGKSGKNVAPPRLGLEERAPLCDAPGTYVHMK